MKRIPACGSIDPRHRSRECVGCHRVYKGKAPHEGNRNPASCVFCGLAQGNSMKVKVLRYPLLRHIDKGGRHTSVCIGSMPMCDRCVMEHGHLNERTRRAA